MKILLIGPQGSGKSTQADLLAQHLGVPKISTGDIFRKLSQVREILNAGKLVDDKITASIVEKKLKEEDYQNGFVMDGYPRNIHQVELFDPGFDKVTYLKVPRAELLRRLLARGRRDDTPESINTRLELYFEQTEPLLDYYKQKGILVEVDGMGEIQKVQDEIKKHL